jgi:hypothetical protein
MEPMFPAGSQSLNAMDRHEPSLETGLAGLEQTASEILRVLEGGRPAQLMNESIVVRQTQEEMLRTQVNENSCDLFVSHRNAHIAVDPRKCLLIRPGRLIRYILAICTGLKIS